MKRWSMLMLMAAAAALIPASLHAQQCKPPSATLCALIVLSGIFIRRTA